MSPLLHHGVICLTAGSALLELYSIACHTAVFMATAHLPRPCQSCLINRNLGNMLQTPITAPQSKAHLSRSRQSCLVSRCSM